MKAKVMPVKKKASYRIFLLLIVPILIGFVIFFTPQAHSDWEKEGKEILQKTPTKQGWAQIEFKDDAKMDLNAEPKKTEAIKD